MKTKRIRYEGSVDGFRNVMSALIGWRPTSGEAIQFYKIAPSRTARFSQNYQTDVLSVWYLLIPPIPDEKPYEPRQAATVKAYKLAEDMPTTLVDFLDGSYGGTNIREPLGNILEQIIEEVIRGLVDGGYRVLPNVPDDLQAQNVLPAAPKQNKPDSSPAQERAEVLGLDYIEQKILEAYNTISSSGMKPTDDLIASRLPTSQKGQPYSRETVNRKRQAMRIRGIKV